MIKNEKGQRAIALCNKCNKTLKNTAISRLSAHRNNCLGMKKEQSTAGAEDDDIVQEEWAAGDDMKDDTQTPIKTTENKVNGVEPQQHQKKHNPPAVQDVVIQEPKSSRVVKPPKAMQSHAETVATKIPPRPRVSQVYDTTNSSSSKFEIKEINDALSGFLIGANLNFDIADSKYFRNFLKKLAPDYEVPTGHELKLGLLKKLSCNQLMDHVEEISDDNSPRGSSKRKMKRSRTNGDRGYKRKYVEDSSSDDYEPVDRYGDRYGKKSYSSLFGS